MQYGHSNPREKVPTKTVFAVVTDLERKKILFVYNLPEPDNQKPGGWGLPGGGVELRETPEEAIAREIRRETGYAMDNALLMQKLRINEYHQIFIYLASVAMNTRGSIVEKKEIREAQWLSLSEFLAIPTLPEIVENTEGIDYKYLSHQDYLLEVLDFLGWTENFANLELAPQ